MEEYAKLATILLREYREVAERIVKRAEKQRYVLAADQAKLTCLNSRVDQIEQALRASLPEKE